MNVFQDLNLDKGHRKGNKVVQLVRNFEDREKQLQKHIDDNPEGLLYGQKKMDGVYGMAVIHSKYGDCVCNIFGRTGKKLQNVEQLESELEEWALDELFEGVLIFELCNFYCSLEVLSGIVNPYRVKPLNKDCISLKGTFWMYFHDVLTLGEFKAGESTRPYHDRHLQLFDMNLERRPVRGCIVRSVRLRTLEGFKNFAQECIEAGHEGAVLKLPDAGWKAGQKNEVMTKIVRGVDYDLEVLGFEEGKGKRKGLVANLNVRWRKGGTKGGEEVTLAVDGRFTDEQRKAWWDQEEEIVGKIVRVHALQLGSKGSLRLPKVRAVRIDKFEADL